MNIIHSRLRFFAVRAVSVSMVFTLMFPAAAFALSSGLQLNARDTQTVTRADFLRGVVKAAGLTLISTGAVPYDKAPEALLPSLRALQSKKALAVFASEGRALNFQKPLRRSEAIAVLEVLTQATASAESVKAAKAFTDATTDADRSLIAIAIDRNWLKPNSATVFGLQKILRGKEVRLLLTRAFKLAPDSENTDTMSSPVIRIKLLTTTHEPAPKSDMLEAVWNALRRDFLYRDRLVTETAGNKAIEGLVNSLGDPYTTYMPKQKNDDFKLQMKGEVEGIGATVEMTGGILTIVSPLRGSPAEKAGLKPKDQILSVDGVTLQGLTLDEAVHHVRGPKDSSAVFKIRRDGNEFDQTITRAQVFIPEVEVTEDRNVAIVKIQQFWDTTDTKFRQTMAEIQSQNPRGIILDLRNNPGGLLHAAGVVAGAFLPKTSPFVTIMESNSTHTEATEEDAIVRDSIPMIVLVNKGSASASEIVAGALQDTKRAKIVGETTYGKGTVQQVMQFPDGSSLKFTIAEWRTPLGRKIDKLGVTPDVVVVNDGKVDLQMEKAMELLR